MWFFVAILQHCTVGKMGKKKQLKKKKNRFLAGKLNFLTLFRMKYSRKSSNFDAKIEFFKS